MTLKKRIKFCESLDYLDTDSKCRYKDASKLIKIFNGLASLTFICGAVLFVLTVISGFSAFGRYLNSNQGSFTNLFFLFNVFGLPVSIGISTLFSYSICKLAACGLNILVDIEKSSRVSAEACYQLVKSEERQKELEVSEVR